MVAFFLLCLCLFLRHHTADDLARLVKCLIVRVNHHLCQDRGYRLVDTSVQKLCTNRILQIISDVSLAHRRADRHRRRRIFRIQTAELIHRRVNHADLRAVAVRDDHLIVLADKISDRFCRALRSFLLLRQCRSQCVMSQCDNDLLFLHFYHPPTLLCAHL